MKIIFIHKYNDISGSTKILNEVVRTLKKDYEYEIITSQHKSGFLSENNIIIKKKIFYYQSNHRFLTLISFLFNQICLFFYILKYLNENVLIYINTIHPFSAALAAKIINKKVIFHIHESTSNNKLFDFFINKIIRFSAAKNIYVSKYILEFDKSIPEHKKYLIYNPVNLPNNIPSRKNKKFNVLMVCSLKKYKGIIEFFKIHNLINNKNIDFTLVLNSDVTKINAFMSKYDLKISNNIKVLPANKNTDIYYCSASIVINLSLPDQWTETFGLSIVEGMSYGCPAIAPNAGGPKEIINDGVNGFLVNPYDSLSIKEIILELYNNKNLYKSLSLNAMKRASCFSRKKFSQKLKRVIKNEI